MITQRDIKKTKRWMTLAEIPAGIAWSGISITYLTGFFLMLKASNFQISLITAIPALCSLASISGGYLLGRLKGKKTCVIITIFLFYIGHALLGAIPFLFHNFTATVQVYVGLGVLACAYVFFKIMEVFWYPWTSGIIPEYQRGKFLGRLMIVPTLIIMPGSYLIGRYLDHANDLAGFFVVFAICGVIGALSIIAYLKLPDVRNETTTHPPSLPEHLRVAIRDKHFRQLLLFLLFNTLASGLCGPFANVFMIHVLHIPYTHIAIFGIILSLMFIVFVAIWGFLIDKYGSKSILLISAAPAVIMYLLWIFNTPEHYKLIPFIFALSGISSAGVGVALGNMLMSVSTGKYNAGYITLYQIILGLMGFTAPLLGSYIVELCAGLQWNLLGYPIRQYQALFGITGLLSVIPLFFIIRLHEPHGKTAMFILRNMVSVNPIKLVIHLLNYYRSFSEKERLSAIIGLGSTGSPMVVSELICSLDDPNYFVRREAALALGRIKDRDALMPLIRKLADEYANIQYEAAWALGSIKDEQSIPPLLESLKSPDARLRSYAAIALGELGAAVAIEPLVIMLEHTRDTFEAICAANALSQLGYKKALWKTLEKLVASDQPVVRRQLSVSLGDLLGERGSFYRLLAREEKVYGEEVSRIMARMSRSIQRHWKARLGQELADNLVQDLKHINDLYDEKQYPAALKEVVAFCERLFGQGVHRFNPTQETGRKFLREILAQNEALGNNVYWEECLLSIHELFYIFNSTERPTC